MFIRPAESSDLAAMMSLLNREIVDGVNIFRLRPLDQAMAERWWQTHGHGRYRAVVAEHLPPESGSPPQLAGWATLAPHSAYEGYDRTAELSVWVDPAMRRRGCGAMLIGALQASCQQRNIRTVISRIESNNQASLRLHENCGFQRAGLLTDVGEKFGQSLSVVLMQYHVPALRATESDGNLPGAAA